MGQYYIPCNLTKKQTLSPYTFGDLAKLREFVYPGSGTLEALAILLASGHQAGGTGELNYEENDPDKELVGYWRGDQIIIAGEYDEDGKWLTPAEHKAGKWQRYEQNLAYQREEIAAGRRPVAVPLHADTPCNLYKYSDFFYEDISQRMDEFLTRCGVRNLPPSNGAVMSALQEILQRRLRYEFGPSRAPADFTWVTHNDIRDLFHDRKPEWITFAKRWLRKQLLQSDVKAALKHITGKGITQKWLDATARKRTAERHSYSPLLGLSPYVPTIKTEQALRPLELTR